MVSRVDLWRTRPYLVPSTDAYAYQGPAGILEFSKEEPFRFLVRDASGTPVIYESFFTIFQSTNATSLRDAAIPVRAVVDLVRRDLYIVRYDLEKDGLLLGRMDLYVFVSLRSDGRPKIEADFWPDANASASTFVVWAVRVPTGEITTPSNERISLASSVQATPVPIVTDRLRVSDSRTSGEAAFVDWSDAKVATTLWLESAGPQEGTWLQVRFPVGEFRIDPTIGTTSSESATAFSTQRKMFLHNGVYWAFWYDAGIKYGWSKDATSWTISTVPNTLTANPGFDVALLGSTVGILWVSSSIAAFFLKGEVLYQAISWSSTVVSIASWQSPLAVPPSIVLSPAGVFAAFIGKYTSGTTYRMQVYRSEDGGATWTPQFSDASDAGAVPHLSTGANSTVYLLWSSSQTTTLNWKWFGPGGWSAAFSQGAFLAGWPRETRVTAVPHPDGKVRVFWIDMDAAQNWQYVYSTKIFEGSWTLKEGPHYTTSVASSGYLLHPAISIDPNGDWHFFFVAAVSGTRKIHYLRETLGSTPAGPTTPIDPAVSPDPAWLAAVPMSSAVIGMIWTRDSGASWAVDATRLPLPSAVGPASLEPWTRSGISPYQSYFSQLADAVNPGTGMLTVNEDDITLPGRGLHASITRLYQEPRVFLGSVPYLYETSPYANVGLGWSLNFPWLGQTYLHLWDGQTAQVDWDQSQSGTIYTSKGAEGFRLVNVMGGTEYHLYTKSGTKYEFWGLGSGGKIKRIVDLTGANIITFNYESGRLSNITDTVGRVITFGYDGSNRLWTVTTGNRTFTYGYNPTNQLTSVTDPVGRTTTFQYSGTTGVNAYLLTRVTYPTGGNTRYTYNLTGIKVGTEALSFPVTLHEVWLPSGLVRSASYSYEAAQGRIEFVKITLRDASTIQGHTEYSHRNVGLYATQTTFDASYGQLEKKVHWYGPKGAPTQTDVYVGNSGTPTHSSTVLMDDWGNQIARRDALGHEAFASYANTATENAFKGFGSVNRIASGKLFSDSFDDFVMSDWEQSWGGGNAVIDSAVYDPSVPGIRIDVASAPGGKLVNHSIPAQSGTFLFESRVRMGDESATPPSGFILLRNGTTSRAKLMFRFDLKMVWLDGGVPSVETDCASYRLMQWYRVTVHVVSTTYDVYLDGIIVCTATLVGSGNIDNIAFALEACCSNDVPAKMWVDEVKVYRDTGVRIQGLRVGQVAELTDPSGFTIWKERSTAALPDPFLSGVFNDPDLNNNRSFEFGADTLRIYSTSRTVEFVSSFRDFWGGDVFVYTPPVEVASLARVEFGMGRWSHLWLDDEVTGPTWFPDNDGWMWRWIGEAPVSGTKFHRSPWRQGIHKHYFQDLSTQQTITSGQFHIQYVRVNAGQYPAEVMLEFRVGTNDPQSWDHRAYWGADSILYPVRSYMGPIPHRPDEWVMLIAKADDVTTQGTTPNGASYTLYGGSAIWDATAIGDANTGLVRVGNLTEYQKVQLTDPGGTAVANATVPVAQTTANLNVYGANIRAFPYRGRLKVYATDGSTLLYVSPIVDVYGGDRWVYTPAEFYVNSVNADTRNRVVGNLAYRTTTSLDPIYHSAMNFLSGHDISFSGNHGSSTGTITSVTGVIGSARRFDGTEDGIRIPDASSLDSNAALSISLWIKPEAYVEPSTSNPGFFVSKWNSYGQEPPGQFIFGFSGLAGKLSLTVAAEDGTVATAIGLTQVPLNVWSHVAVVYDRGQYALLRNGITDGSGSLSVSRMAGSEYPNDDVWIARNWYGNYEFTGSMDELIVTDRALPAEDVAVLYRTQYWTGAHPVQKSYTKYTAMGLVDQAKILSRGKAIIAYNEFDAYGNHIKITDPLNRVTTFVYGGSYQSAYMTSTSQPLGIVSSFSYNFSTGMRSQEIDPLGGFTDNTYDKLLRILTTTYPTVSGVRHSISYAYNDAANTVTITDELGHQTRHTFDAIGRGTKVERLNAGGSVYSTETFTYNWQDRVVSQTTAAGLTYTSQYDSLGRVIRATNPDTTYRAVSYDDVNNLVTAADEVGRKARYRYDWAGRQVEVGEWNPTTGTFQNLTTMKYDGMGDLVGVTDSASKTTMHVYDDLGQVTVAIYPDAAGTYEKYTYDDVGNLVSKQKRNGQVLAFQSDALNRLKVVTYPSGGGTVTYDYDKMGNTKKVVNSATLWYEYDARNRMTKESALVGGTNRTILYGYDGASNLVSMTYPDGTVYTYTPDAFNRVSDVKLGAATLAAFTYRTDNRIGSVTLGNGVLTWYDYDNRARPLWIDTNPKTGSDTIRPTANGDTIQWSRYPSSGQNWDKVDDVTSDGDATSVYATTGAPLDLYQQGDIPVRGYAITSVTVYAVAKYEGPPPPPPGCPPNCPEGPEGDSPDPTGSIYLAVKTGGTVQTSTERVLTTVYATYSWTMATNPVTGGAWTEAQVNALQAGVQLVSTTTKVNVTQVYVAAAWRSNMDLRLDYGYNAASDVTSLAITPPTGSAVAETFRYDGQDRLDRWTSNYAPSTTHTYAYTSAGDRTSLNDNGQVTTYAYNNDHQLDSYAPPSQSWNLDYDPNGNAKWRNQTNGNTKWVYTYDAEDRLTQVQRTSPVPPYPLQILGTYSYDGLGRRVKVVEGSTTTYFVYSGLSLVQTSIVSGPTTRFVYASGLLIARTVSTTNTYVHSDALGSVRAASDANGNWVYVTQYKPFGQEYGTSGSWSSLKYTGEWKDANTGLYYLYKRFYDPDLGRFLSQDPVLGSLGDPQSLDRYPYVANNPVTSTDPTGMTPDCSALPSDDEMDPWERSSAWRWSRETCGVAVEFDERCGAACDAGPMILGAILGLVPGLETVMDLIYTVDDCRRAWLDPTDENKKWCGVSASFLATPFVGGGLVRFTRVLRSVDNLPGGTMGPWKLGDPVNAPTPHGYPGWKTVRERYWKNAAEFDPPGRWSQDQIARMRGGRAPLDPMTDESWEIHHIGGRGIADPHNPSNLRPYPRQFHRVDIHGYVR